MPSGIFRQVEKPTYDGLLMGADRRRDRQERPGRLPRLLNAGTTWIVEYCWAIAGVRVR